MSNYYATQSLVQDRQLKVQRLVIPFQVVGNATPANVVVTCDEPGFLFFQSEGVNQITAALATNETATYTDATPVDADGELNILVRINEPLTKIMGASIHNRDASAFTALTGAGANLGSATGITTGSGGGQSIMLSIDTGGSSATGTTKRCIVVEYIVEQ